MKLSRRLTTLFTAFVALGLGIAVFPSGAAAQTGGWFVIRADYGFRAQRKDVTGIVKDLVARGGVNGYLAVNNQTMGGDPAPGADKILRIFVANDQGQNQEFDYREGSFAPANMFAVMHANRDDRMDRGDRDDRNDAGDRDDHQDNGDRFAVGRDRADWNRVSIVMAFWGAQGRMVSVTDLLQHMVRNGALTVVANNSSMGMDPAPGAGKILIVVYQYRGQEQAAAASEGHMLSLP
jgi:Domain of unknown function (DUF3395)